MSGIGHRPNDAIAGAPDNASFEVDKMLDPAQFRQAMSQIGAAVHVVTTDGPAGKTGLTATAVCSVSDAPPMLLVCVNRSSRVALAVRDNGVFCINTLGAGAEATADLFAGRTGIFAEERFSVGEWTKLATRAPVLLSAMVSFDCRIADVKEVGSHYVIFGSVEAVRLGASGKLLVYHDRSYKRA